MEQVVNSLGDALNPWGYVLLFAVTLLEASAFIGLFVPGETALMLAGFLAYQGRVSLPVVIVVAVLGAIIGDSCGYEIGRHLGGHMRRSWAGKKVGEERWDKARDYVRAKGGRAVLLGRWVGLLRALVPAVAGDSRMPYRTFLTWNVLGAIVHTPLIVVVGYLAGGSYAKVDRYMGRATLGVFALVVAVAIAIHLVRKRREEPATGASGAQKRGT